MDDVAVKRIPAGRHVRELLGERAAVCELGVQVPDEVHSGHSDHVKVHEVTMIGQQIVCAAVEPAGVLEIEREARAFYGGFQRKRLIDDAAVTGGLRTPPGIAAPNDDAED